MEYTFRGYGYKSFKIVVRSYVKQNNVKTTRPLVAFCIPIYYLSILRWVNIVLAEF